MTKDGNPNNLDEKANVLAALILGGAKEKEADPESTARAVLQEDKPDARPLPAKPKKKAALSDYTRAKALKILELRVQGHSFDEIAEKLDYKSGKHVRAAYTRLMDKHEKESVDNLRALQNERLEMAWRGLAPKVAQGRERAVEVAMKVMERQARLQGLDVADQLVEKTSNQPIQINIMAHPGDARAQAMIIEQEPRELEERKE